MVLNNSELFHIHQYNHSSNTTFYLKISMALFITWNQFDTVYIPIIIVTGLIGNIFACYVLMSTELRKSSPSVYLAALTLSNVGYLVGLTIFWLSMVGLDVYNVNGMCQFVTFVFNYFIVFSTWVVMLFTIERYVVIFYPLAKLAICSAENARRNCLILALFPALLEVILFANTGITTSTDGTKWICGPLPSRAHVSVIHHLIDMTLGALVPFLVTTGINLIVCRKLFRISEAQRKLTQSVPNSSLPRLNTNELEVVTYTSSNQSRATIVSLSQKNRHVWSREARGTWSLLCIAVVFSCLNFPYNYVSTKKEVILMSRDLQYSAFDYSISRLSVDIFYLQFALDFVSILN